MTYQEMCEFQTLYEAYLEARKGKRSKPGTAQYEANALICTDKLSYVLNQKTYKPSGFEVFYVYEPKKRLVQAPAFVDKVVLHALTDNVLYDTICTSFIRDNHASQRGKGTLDAIVRLKGHMVDYYRKNGIAPMVRILSKNTGYKLKEVYELFPSGPGKGACKMAGLPKPTGCV